MGVVAQSSREQAKLRSETACATRKSGAAEGHTRGASGARGPRARTVRRGCVLLSNSTCSHDWIRQERGCAGAVVQPGARALAAAPGDHLARFPGPVLDPRGSANAGGGNRTHTPRGARDFESRASASSATPARRIVASARRRSRRPETGFRRPGGEARPARSLPRSGETQGTPGLPHGTVRRHFCHSGRPDVASSSRG